MQIPQDRLSENTNEARVYIIDLLMLLSREVVITVNGRAVEGKFELNVWIKPPGDTSDIFFHEGYSAAQTHRSLNGEVKARVVARILDGDRESLINAAMAAGWTVREDKLFTKLRHPDVCK